MNFLNQTRRFFRKLRRRRSSEPEVGSSQQEQLQSSQSNFGVLSDHESTFEYLQYRNRAYDPKPTFPYPEEHTIWFEYLGRYSPEPNWKRWLSPFHHKTPQNAFCRGMTVNKESLYRPVFFGIPDYPDPPDFFRMLSRAVKRRLSRGYRVGVLTPNHKFYTKVSVKYTKEDQEAKGSYSMTFEDGHGYWKSCGFDWGKTLCLRIWILLQRRPDQPISSTSITFLIQETTHPRPTFRTSSCASVYLQNVWPRFSAAVNKYVKKYQKKYAEPLPEDIINDFRDNFRYNILVPYREYIYSHQRLDDWGFCWKSFGFDINDNQQPKFSHNSGSSKILRDPNFVDTYIKTLQTFQMIGSDLAIMPRAMLIWKALQGFLNSKFEEIRVENWDVMFGNPTKQDDLFEGNVLEVASFAIPGNSRSNEPIAIDPDIETTTYSVFLESIRELPFKLNRWCQVDRSESKPIPFIRGLQFPCQKAYSAFATKTEAEAEILQRLELYRHFFEKILAIPIIKCKTSELEKFAVEVFLPNVAWSGGSGSLTLPGACCIRGATAHCLGQNVLENLNKKREKATAWLNSWSCSIRVIGLMVMVHGNENGFVLPPKVAPKQVIVTSRHNICDPRIRDRCNRVVDMLCKAGIRADADLDNFQLPEGCWEDKSVPLLIKVGPEQVEAHRHDNKKIISLPISSMLERAEMVLKVKEILDEIQKSLFEAAKGRQEACIQMVKTWDEFVEAVQNMQVILAPWCDEKMVEKDVKAKLGLMSCGYGVKILCSPLDQSGITEDTKCFASGKPAKKWTYWGRNLLDEF